MSSYGGYFPSVSEPGFPYLSFFSFVLPPSIFFESYIPQFSKQNVPFLFIHPLRRVAIRFYGHQLLLLDSRCVVLPLKAVLHALLYFGALKVRIEETVPPIKFIHCHAPGNSSDPSCTFLTVRWVRILPPPISWCIDV